MGKHLKSPKNGTPDEWLRGQSRLDKPPHGLGGTDMSGVIRGATDIARSPHGPDHDMDKASHAMHTEAEASLGAGGGRLGDAARSISSGAKAPCVDWSHIRKG